MNNFFSSLKATGILQLGMSISFENDMVSVSILPKSTSEDKGLKKLKPLNLVATIAEMDSKFFEVVTKPLQSTKTVFENVQAYEASLKASKENTEGAKKQKDTVNKKVSTLKELVNGAKFNALREHSKAIKLANDVLALNPDHKEAKKILNEMKQYQEPQLFGHGD